MHGFCDGARLAGLDQLLHPGEVQDVLVAAVGDLLAVVDAHLGVWFGVVWGGVVRQEINRREGCDQVLRRRRLERAAARAEKG